MAPAGQHVKLKFDEFELDNGFDVLKIYDGPNDMSTRIARLSGLSDIETEANDITSSGNTLYLTFASDFNVGNKGFKIYYFYDQGILLMIKISVCML